MSRQVMPHSPQEGSPSLYPPGKSPSGDTKRKKTWAPLVVLLFLFLVLGAVGVLFLKPATTPSNSSPQKLPPKSANSATNQQPDPQIHAHHEEAMQMLEKVLSLTVRAEAANTSQWGEKKYLDALSIKEQADHLFKEQKYIEATTKYDEASSALHRLLAAKMEMFHSFLNQGDLALAEENSKQALEQFTKALAIDPDSHEAEKGFLRATTLPEVARLHKEAIDLENKGNLSAAKENLTQLLALDNEYQAGHTSLNRIQKKIGEITFQKELGNFYAALANNTFAQARTSLMHLKKQGLHKDQIAQAEVLLAEKETAHTIKILREKADKMEAAEKWQEALGIYRQALTIAPEALFANSGQKTALKRIKLDKGLTDIITRPARLQNDAQRESAKNLFLYAQQISPQGPTLKAQIKKVETLITVASTPVSVTLDSDNRTDIVMYHVGKLGHFYQKRLLIKPGKYTVVGKRLGFRDMRKVIDVQPQNAANHFYIQCKEPI